MSFRSRCTTSCHSRVSQMQLDLVASLYLLSTGQVTRAWSLCNEAISEAMSLGLHADFIASNLSENFKEVRWRLWWSLCGLHYHLSVMTGRPSLLAQGMTTERVPASTDKFTHVREASQTLDTVYPESDGTVPEKNSTNIEIGQLYFTELSKLVSIGQQMMSRYYSTIKVQQTSSTKALWIIRELLNEVDMWSTTLPDGLNTRVTGTSSKSKITRQRLSLELQYHGIRITITRPTLDVQVSESTDQND
ncbi:hypothetical protein BJX62DRAFT_98624 [Aspergillus germanicus]